MSGSEYGKRYRKKLYRQQVPLKGRAPLVRFLLLSDGSGGGKPDMAQGGIKDNDKVKLVMDAVPGILKGRHNK